MSYFRNDDEIFDEEGPPNRYTEYKDDDSEEFTSVERTHTTTTEKITSGRRSRTSSKKVDLGAATNYGKDDTTSQVCVVWFLNIRRNMYKKD